MDDTTREAEKSNFQTSLQIETKQKRKQKQNAHQNLHQQELNFSICSPSWKTTFQRRAFVVRLMDWHLDQTTVVL